MHASIETYDVMYGVKIWRKNGEFHRENGPAIEYPDGDKVWYQYGQLHREDGPAIIHLDGTKMWYLNGQHYSEPDYYKRLFELGLISEQELVLKLI